MTAPSLRGRQIGVTRPAAQCGELAEQIRRRGGRALIDPLIVIVPISDSAEIRAAREGLDDFDIAFFVSPNAVECGLAAMAREGGWPDRLKVATVGEGSARALYRRGFDEVLAPRSGADTEAVLALPEFAPAALHGRKVVVFRGEGGRELFGDSVRERGAAVCHVACYRRRAPDGGGARLLSAAAAGALDALIMTSSEAASNLLALVGRDAIARLAEVVVFAPHERIAERCRQIGFCRIVTTAPGNDGLLAALDAHFASVG